MSFRLVLLAVVLVLFSVLTGLALLDVGFLGILLPHFRALGPGQVFADLAIMATLSCIWMVQDARSRGGNPWPFVILTLIAGSYGPLIYLVLRELQLAKSKTSAA
ncbi:MAG: hypothetical protein JNM83_08895 [Myxococcales bacterium]|nr:hypothetical protein [Myxococcales bacterium]